MHPLIHDHSFPTFPIPADACDCHMHVFGDPSVFPGKAGHSYLPSPASLADWRLSFTSLGVGRAVVIQPSCYGHDNNCTVGAIAELGDRARGMASIASDIDDVALAALHTAGIRGVRINAKSEGLREPDTIRRHIVAIAERIAPLGWHIQMYVAGPVVRLIADTIRTVRCPVVLDHMGGIRADHAEADLRIVRGLLQEGRCWVKLSGAYRVSRLPTGYDDTLPIARALLRANPDNVVWGSDWPHTAEHAGRPQSAPKPIAFRAIKPASLLRLLAAQCEDERRYNRVLVDNPARLYGF